MGELIFNAFLALVDLVAIIACFSIEISDQPMVRYWPLSILIVLFVMFAYKIFKLGKTMPKEERDKLKQLRFLGLNKPNIVRMVLAFAVSIVYASLLPYFGYLPCTLLYGFAMAFLLGGKCWWKNLLASLVITVILFAIFTYGLGIHPARGMGAFARFSKWLEYLF